MAGIRTGSFGWFVSFKKLRSIIMRSTLSEAKISSVKCFAECFEC